jgi:hypothetical protein
MQTKLTGIDRWKKVAAEKRNETTRDKHQGTHAAEHHAPMLETPTQCIHIPCPKFFEPVIEFSVNLAQEIENFPGDTATPSGPFLAPRIIALFFATVRIFDAVGQACVDFIEMST